jgi:wobble nucleotide-excising tRNase
MARGPIKKRDFDDEIQKNYERIERLKGHIKEVEDIIAGLEAEKEAVAMKELQEVLKATGMKASDLLALAKASSVKEAE